MVRVYAERADSRVDRPARWLVGSAVARAEEGESVTALVRVSRRDLAYWEDGWVEEPGEYWLRIGSSVFDLPLEVTVSL